MDQLPPGSATFAHRAKLPPGWDVHAFLATDLFKAFTGQEHPARPKPTTTRYASLRERLEDQRRRLGGARTP